MCYCRSGNVWAEILHTVIDLLSCGIIGNSCYV